MRALLEQAKTLQDLLVAHATDGRQDENTYQELRDLFIADQVLAALLPECVRTCRNLAQFWSYIKRKSDKWEPRRQFLWSEFQPLLEHLERGPSPSDGTIDEILRSFDPAHIHAAWSKALARRESDPEGAITASRTLLESVCKHILADANVIPDDGLELSKLYKLTAAQLQLAPDQHTELVFKQILGGCATVVEGLGSLRNKLSDAHGRGPAPVKPAARHAELAVNLAGALATYLIATKLARKDSA